MISQFEQPEQNRPPSVELMVEIDFKDKQGNQEHELLGQHRRNIRSKRKMQPKSLPIIERPHHSLQEFLDTLLEKSSLSLPMDIQKTIRQQIDALEHKVFANQTNQNQKPHFRSLQDSTGQNEYVKEGHQDKLIDFETIVQKDIKEKVVQDSYIKSITSKESEVKQLEKADRYRVRKLKESQRNNKMNYQKNEFDETEIKSGLKNKLEKLENIGREGDKNYYSIDHSRIKKSQLFLRQLQQKRKQDLKQYDVSLSLKRQQLAYQKQKEAQMKQIERMQRRTKLKEYYESKLQQRLEVRKIEKQKKQEFKDWSKAYYQQRPLQAVKQEQFRTKVLIPQLEEKHRKLINIRVEYKSIEPEQNDQYRINQIQGKKDDTIRKSTEDRAPGDILEGQTISNKKFVRRVRNRHDSLNLGNGKESTEELMPQIESARPYRKQSQQLDSRQLGLHHRSLIKNMARESMLKQEQNDLVLKAIGEKSTDRPMDTLELEKQSQRSRKKSTHTRGIQSNDTTNKQITNIKGKADLLDERLKRQQAKIKITDSFENKAQVQKDHIVSIKEKMPMLGQFS